MTEHTNDVGDLQKLLDEATPGPWEIGPRITKKDGPAYERISGGDWISFARVWVRMEFEDSDSPEGLANARLIAMAPDLAAALILAKEALTALVDEYCDYATINLLGDPERQHNIKLARTALDAINKLGPPK